MEIKALESDSSLVLGIRGVLDTNHSQDLEKFIESKMGMGYRKFLLDLSLLDSLSSGGIAFFIRLLEKKKSSSGFAFAITQVNGEVMRILRFFGLDKTLTIFQKLDSAKEYLSRIQMPRTTGSSIPSSSKNRPFSSSVSPSDLVSDSTKIGKRGLSIIDSKENNRYRDRIQFYYKGEVSPESYSYRKGYSKINTPEMHLERLPESRLEPIEEETPSPEASIVSGSKENSPKEKSSVWDAEEILQRLESRIDDLKKDVKTNTDQLENKLLTHLEEKLQHWERNNSTQKELISQDKKVFQEDRKVSKDEKNISQEEYIPSKEEIIHCESCGTKLRVRKMGHYKCPKCSTEFYYKDLKSLSFLEKLT